MRILVQSRAYRENHARFKAALEANKERGDRAMAEALEACAELGRRAGASLAHQRDQGMEPTVKQKAFIEELADLTQTSRLSLGEIATKDDATRAIEFLLDKRDGGAPIRHATRQAVFAKLRETSWTKEEMYLAVGVTTLDDTATERDGQRCLRWLKGEVVEVVKPAPVVAAPVAAGPPRRWVPGRPVAPPAPRVVVAAPVVAVVAAPEPPAPVVVRVPIPSRPMPQALRDRYRAREAAEREAAGRSV